MLGQLLPIPFESIPVVQTIGPLGRALAAGVRLLRVDGSGNERLGSARSYARGAACEGPRKVTGNSSNCYVHRSDCTLIVGLQSVVDRGPEYGINTALTRNLSPGRQWWWRNRKISSAAREMANHAKGHRRAYLHEVLPLKASMRLTCVIGREI
jgi:hypothetical protein